MTNDNQIIQSEKLKLFEYNLYSLYRERRVTLSAHLNPLWKTQTTVSCPDDTEGDGVLLNRCLDGAGLYR